MKKKSVIFLILGILSTVFIFSNSCTTAEISSEQSGRIVNLLSRIMDCDTDILTVIVRKLAHMFEFFLQSLAVCLFIGSLGKFPKYVIYTLFTGLLTACTDEFLQLFFDGRGSMVSDVFIDFSGTIIGAIIYFIIYTIIKKTHTKKKMPAA